MAIGIIKQQLDKILDNYNYNRELQTQSESASTCLYYDKVRAGEVVAEASKALIMQYGVSEEDIDATFLRSTSEAQFDAVNTESNWEGACNPYYTILQQAIDPSTGFPGDYEDRQSKKDQIAINKIGSYIEIEFFRSYVSGRGVDEASGYAYDNMLTAQREVLVLAVDAVFSVFANKPEAAFNSLKYVDHRMRASGETLEDSTFAKQPSSQDLSRSLNYKSVRAHGVESGHVGSPAIGKTDTTVALLHFIDKLDSEGSHAVEDALQEHANQNFLEQDFANKVLNRWNTKFNAAYKIDGLTKIDLFKFQDVLKHIKIKIVFGTADKNELMAEADFDTSRAEGIQSILDHIESELLNEFSDPNERASRSMAEIYGDTIPLYIMKKLEKKAGGPDMRFKINKQLFGKAKKKDSPQKGKGFKKSKGRVKKRITKRVTPKVKKAKRSAKQAPVIRRAVGKGSSKLSPIRLQALINAKLPKQVAAKMTGGKTLQYRTGRFAASAEVKAVTQGPRGGYNIDYSYMKYPYQTFEPGFAQGSTFRDPRLLIGGSIREVATQIMQQRFTGGIRRI